MNAYPHLKTVSISPFENLATEFEIAQNSQNDLVERFQKDGRLKISNINPDVIIEGRVLDYKHDIISYDIAGNISEYRVQILFSIIMTDMVKSEVLFENKSMLMSDNYFPNEADNPGFVRFTTELEAQEGIYKQVFDRLVRSTLESW
jgi:hypothetical protein